MKTMLDLNTKKVPAVRIDPSLDKYDNIVLFPDKLQKANKKLNQSNFPFPKTKNQEQ
jgi:hypothetical protein